MIEIDVILLAAGCSKYSDRPCSLWALGNGSSILDWQIDTFNTSLPSSNVNIVVGYDHQRIIEQHPKHNFSLALDWQNSNALKSFLDVISGSSKHLVVMYGDTVFRSETLKEFLQ